MTKNKCKSSLILKEKKNACPEGPRWVTEGSLNPLFKRKRLLSKVDKRPKGCFVSEKHKHLSEEFGERARKQAMKQKDAWPWTRGPKTRPRAAARASYINSSALQDLFKPAARCRKWDGIMARRLSIHKSFPGLHLKLARQKKIIQEASDVVTSLLFCLKGSIRFLLIATQIYDMHHAMTR